MLRITEIFHSIQGESSHAGRPCAFVRLAGCNLRCRWCDSEYTFTGGDHMSLDDVVMRSTAAPAKILGYEGTVGTLSPGANADIAVFELRDGNFPLRDSDGNTITAKRRLITQLTIKDGRVWYERPPE